MSYTIMIPARYGSSRLPGKVLLPIQGQPIIQHVYARAKESQAEKIYVLTDHEDIADAARAVGAEVMMTHPDCASGTDRITEAVEMLGLEDEVIVNLQGDEPFIEPLYIDTVAQALIERSSIPVATLAHELSDKAEIENPNVVKVVLNHDFSALYFSRSVIPMIREPHFGVAGFYLRHIGLYAYRASFLKTLATLSASPLQVLEGLEQLKVLWHGYPIHVEIVDRPQYGDINTREDYDALCALLNTSL